MRRMVENLRDFDSARKLRERFVDRPMEKVTDQQWSWPRSMEEVGVCTAVMYRSDKWEKKRGKFTDYKHIIETPAERHKLLISKDFDLGLGAGVDLFPERYDLDRMPDAIAELANTLGIQFQLYDRDGKLGDDYQCNIVRAKVGAAMHPNGETMLLVYTKSTLCCLITGFEVEKDGIVK